MAKRTNPRETVIERTLRVGVEARGGMCIKFKDPARRGAPDRLVVLPGFRAMFVELKRPKGGKLAAHQKRYHDDLRAMWQPVFVLWTLGQVDSFFDGLDG